MNRNFIFAFILLATLSLVNAFPHQLQKRTTAFKQCPPPVGSTTPPPLISVTLKPDPVVPGQPDMFTISGTLDSDITDTTVLFSFYGDPVAKSVLGDPYQGPVCTGTGCPIKAKTPFSTDANITTPATLPDPYIILVAVVEPPQSVLGCALTFVGETPPEGAAYAALPFSLPL